jgi:hypothetical protein
MKTSRANTTNSFQFRTNNQSQLMRKAIKLTAAVFLLLTMCAIASAQNVTVAGSTGANGSYPTLGDAFTAINANTNQTGNAITISIVGDTTEAASAVLNEATGGAWASVSITPSGTRTVSGAIAGNLIDLNGADNVTLDGLGSLTIENTTSGATSTTIRFIADATNNTVQNCTIKGSGTIATLGTIFFSTGTTTGNDGNVISNNTITSSGATNPTNAIFSSGTSAAIDNSGITVSGNNVSDYFNATLVSVGINLSGTGNSTWTISNNKLFQTATRVYTASNTHNGINVGTGAGYTISGNTIGFANSGGTGTTNIVGLTTGALGGTFPSAYTTGGTANATRYIAINAAFTAGGAVSNIQNNTMAGFALYTSSGASTTNGIWCGINVTSGNANIGTTTGNTIGATSGNGSIYTAATTTGGTAVGIFATSTNTVSIQNNTMGAVDAVGTTATTAGGFTGIDTAGAAGVFTINSNTIGNTTADNIRTGFTQSGANLSNTGTLTSTTGATAAIVGIRNTASGATLSINTNTLRGWATSGTVTAVTGITNTGAITTTVTNNNNLLGTAAVGWIRYAFANSGALTGISKSGTATLTSIAINNNDFQGIVNSVAGSQAHTYISFQVGATNNINGNTFTNLNVNTTGSVTFLNHGTTNSMTATGTLSSSNNQIVTGFNKASAGGTVTFFTAGAGDVSPNGSTILYNLNNFSNVTLTGVTAVLALSDANGASNASGPTKTITNNTFNSIVTGAAQITGISFNFSGNGTTVSNNTLTNLTGGLILSLAAGTSNSGASQTISGNTFSNFVASGQINALQTGFGPNLTTGNITGNTITNLSSTSAAANPIFTIISSGFGVTTNISKNKIGNVQSDGNALAGSVVFGILVQTAGTTYNISNNVVGDLRMPSASGVSQLVGVSVGTLTAASTVNLLYNTIWLNNTTNSGAIFGSSAVSASTTPTVVLRNNILVNTSVNNTTGLTVAYRRSDATLGTYGAASNNNDFYAGTPGANNLIFNDGTNSDQTIAAYKVRVGPRDSASVTENPAFLSTAAANANFLHINAATPTQLESGAVNIAGITDDFDGDIRQGNPGYGGSGSAPDVGADEFNGIAVDLAPPVISYTLLGNEVVAATRNLANVTVTDASGVNIAPGTRPRVYYKKTTDANTFNDNTNATAGWKFAEANGAGGSPFTFTINYSLLFGGGGVSVGDTVQYFVVAQDTVVPTPNVGINSGTFAATPTSVALTAAAFPLTGTINSYLISDVITGTKTVCTAGCDYTSLTNALGVFADINAKVLSGNVIIQVAGDLTGETGANALNTLSENPGGSNFTVTILPTGAPRSITSTVGATSLIKLNGASRVTIDGSIGGGGSDRSLTIENIGTVTPSVVWMGSVGSSPISNDTLKNCIIRNGVNTSSAVFISDAGTLANPGFFSNITIQNNDIQKALVGVFANGGTTPQNGSNLIYTQNTLTSTALNAIRNVGLYMQGVNGATVSQNTVSNINNTNDENDMGIWLASGTINATVSGNTISTVGYSGANAFAPIGINITSSVVATNNNVSGNSVSSITTNGSSQVRGISVSGTTADMTVQGNNVQGVINTNIGTFGAYGIDLNGGNNIVVKNNFVSNVTHDMSGGAAFSTTFGVFGIRVGSGSNIVVDHNSVNLYGAMTGTTATSLLSAGFAIVGTGSQNCDVRNNIFANNITGGSTSIAAVSAFLPSAGTAAMNLNWNNNAYFFGTDAARQGVGQAGTTAGTGFFTTLPALAAYSSTLSGAGTNDNASQASTGAVPFINNNDLHITPAAGAILGGGAAIATITTDFDNDPRPASNPDIGADELVQAVAASIPAGTYYNASAAGGDSLGGNVTITNALYLNGILNTGANTLTIDCNATVNGASPTSYVNGNLQKNYCATGVKGFEVGTANGYSPVSVNATAGTFPANFTVKAIQGPQPSVNAATSLQRYWTLTEGGAITANVNFNYLDPTDIAGTEANYHVIRVIGGTPTSFPNNCPVPGATQACVDFAGNQATVNGVTNFSDWTLGTVSAPTAAPATISGRITTTSGAPLAGVTMRLEGGRTAMTITDANGNYRFVNVPVEQFYTVTPFITNYHFSPASRAYSLVANQTDATFTGGRDEVASGNVIDMPEFFVRQHYLDFLGREPDNEGLAFWSNQMRGCGNDYNCLERRTINVSAAYFLSIEFQKTGALVDSLYGASYGRAPRYSEFLPDTARVGRDVIVNQPDWEGQLARNTEEFLGDWVQRAAFRAAYDNLTNDSYIDALISNTGVTFTASERATLRNGLNEGTLTRAQVLQRIAQNGSFVDARRNEMFVRMQYFGYLRRDADDAGFHFWLNKLNEFEGNFERAEMVKAFLVSGEYRDRFRSQ